MTKRDFSQRAGSPVLFKRTDFVFSLCVEQLAEARIFSSAQTVERLEAARETISPRLQAALERYVERVERDAIAGLNRPHWLLSRSIASKVKSYAQNQKFWASVGVKRETKELRDPGVYWKYHETGSTPDGYRRSAPKRFLRTARDRNEEQLKKDVVEAYSEIREIYKRGA